MDKEIVKGIIEHMNEDHMDAMQLILEHRHQVCSEQVEMVEVDESGYTLEVPGGERFRVIFPEAATDSGKVRKMLIQQVNQARKALA